MHDRPAARSDDTTVLDALIRAVGRDAVTTDPATVQRFGSDLHHDGPQLLAVVRPSSIDALRSVVRVATSHGRPVVPRGGGVSYTAGYLVPDPGAVLVDTAGLNRVIEISAEDGYVTVQAGCTWATLYAALDEVGCRAAFYGPFSGAFATVGGAVSQSAVVWGAGRYGASADSVLSLSVVTANGTLLRTGHDATTRPDGTSAPPHYRPYGPDLTGLFLGDCGALGVKATVTLRLVDRPAAIRPLTFAFDDDDQLVTAMAELARRELGATVVATDAAMARQRIRRAALEDGRLPADDDVGHTLHVVVEGPTSAGVDAEADLVTAVCTRHGGADAGPEPTQELVDLRFLTMTSSVGPDGERWAPLHTIVPRSAAADMWARLRGLEVAHADDLTRHRVTVAYLLTTVSTQAVIIEPALYWPGPRRPIHDLVMEPAQRDALPEHDADPAADAFVAAYRDAMLGLFASAGSAHLQIGRTYPYAPTRDPATLALLSAVKRHLDPDGLVNPGVLGL